MIRALRAWPNGLDCRDDPNPAIERYPGNANGLA